jgi:sugar phosphate isomerase/epimerase
MLTAMTNRMDQIVLYWTTSGIYPGDGEISRFDFAERVESVAKAGFKGVGIWHTDLEHIMQSRPLKEMKRILDANGIEYLELEFLTDWFADGARRRESDSRRRRLLEASAALEATHIKVGDFYSSSCSMDRVIDCFGELCHEADRFSARIGFEIMDCAMVHTVADAVAMVKGAGARNGGLILDAVQVANIGMSCDEIRSIPLEYLMGVELDDGTLPGAPGHDASARRFCGEGEFDLPGLIGCVKDMGFQGPWAVEVFNRELCGLPLDVLANRAYSTTAATLVRAGVSP